LTGDLKGKKFALIQEAFLDATPGVKRVLNAAIATIKAAGAIVEDVHLPEYSLGDSEHL
jgi:Asp-tRNA(Asn)/Glu-tRNA(Gln) amidotransferase A subunit family amidase